MTTNNFQILKQTTMDFKKLKEMPDSKMKQLNSEGDYFKFETPDIYHFICTGFDSFKKDGKIVEVLKLENELGKKFVNGSTILLNSVKDSVSKFPVYLRIEYKGKEKNKSDESQEYDMFIVKCLEV